MHGELRPVELGRITGSDQSARDLSPTDSLVTGLTALLDAAIHCDIWGDTGIKWDILRYIKILLTKLRYIGSVDYTFSHNVVRNMLPRQGGSSMAYPSTVANTQLRATPEVHLYDENLIYDIWCHIIQTNTMQKSCRNKHFLSHRSYDDRVSPVGEPVIFSTCRVTWLVNSPFVDLAEPKTRLKIELKVRLDLDG